MRIYLDTAPIIYLVEQKDPFAAQVLSRISAPGTVLVSSDLALLETLVVPLRSKSLLLVRDFNDFFALQIRERIHFTESVFREAADIRAQHNFRTPDALHLAAAHAGACDSFLTNDAGLTAYPNIHVEVVS